MLVLCVSSRPAPVSVAACCPRVLTLPHAGHRSRRDRRIYGADRRHRVLAAQVRGEGGQCFSPGALAVIDRPSKEFHPSDIRVMS